MIFLAGHGTNDPANHYLFQALDYDEEDPGNTCISSSYLRTILESIHGSALLLLDTCHAGNAMGRGKTKQDIDLTKLDWELGNVDRTVAIFSACKAKQRSQESPNWQNGAFTKALVEGLNGKGDLLKIDGRITVHSLEAFVAHYVEDLTGKTQTPNVCLPNSVGDFEIATSLPQQPSASSRFEQIQ